MQIRYDQRSRTFKLDTPASSYVMHITQEGYLLHLYYGSRVSDADLRHLLCYADRGSFSPNPPGSTGRTFSLDNFPQEYSCNGTGDYRISALAVGNGDGNNVTGLQYLSHRILEGKPDIPGQPATFASEGEAQTLEISLEDAVTGARVALRYTVFSKLDAIARSTVVRNASARPLTLERVHSTCVDFPHQNFELVHLYGKWARERMVERAPLRHGIQGIASKRGASGHSHNPFAALVSPDAGEDRGDAYGFSLIYSGNFSMEVEVDGLHSTRVLAGINPEGFAWRLEPGEEFFTPEAVTVYSREGLGGMSRTFHRLYRSHLCRGQWNRKKRPVLINSWEAAYFDFDDERLLAFAKSAGELGAEMLVMDDGWFGRRDSDNSSLGDWTVDERKIRCGLPELVRRVNEAGLAFGIWYEPEMVSPDSDLFRAHPDWCLHVPGRACSPGRDQLVLDMSRQDVRDYLFAEMSKVLGAANITYVKWDFNRNLTEAGSALLPPERQREVFHRYVLGLYELLERLTGAFPHILWEGCSGGGGRFDPAMLYYSPQIWASDNTDALDRLLIQYGTSFVYPASTMASHVSACPNHQTGRTVPLKTRGNVALWGTFGYELSPASLTEEEREAVRGQIRDYHRYWNVVQNGELYRLLSPFENPCAGAVQFVAEDKSETLVLFVLARGRVNTPYFLTLRGLDPDRVYRDAAGNAYHGDTLMHAGLNFSHLRLEGDSELLYLKADR